MSTQEQHSPEVTFSALVEETDWQQEVLADGGVHGAKLERIVVAMHWDTGHQGRGLQLVEITLKTKRSFAVLSTGQNPDGSNAYGVVGKFPALGAAIRSVVYRAAEVSGKRLVGVIVKDDAAEALNQLMGFATSVQDKSLRQRVEMTIRSINKWSADYRVRIAEAAQRCIQPLVEVM